MQFPVLSNPELAEFVGILLGDGSIGIYKCKAGNKVKTQYKVQVTLNSNEEQFMRYIGKLIKRLFNVTPNISYRKTNAVDIRIFRKGILNFLTNKVGMVLSPKWNRAKIPNRYLKNKLELSVIRGLFDTDGSVVLANNHGSLYPRLEIKISPSPMQKQVLEILRRRKFNVRVRKIGKKKINVGLNGKLQLKKWLRVVGFSNNKHIQRAEKVIL